MASRTPPDDSLPEMETFACTGCGETVDADEAQAARWAYWDVGSGDVWPYCVLCAARQFGANG